MHKIPPGRIAAIKALAEAARKEFGNTPELQSIVESAKDLEKSAFKDLKAERFDEYIEATVLSGGSIRVENTDDVMEMNAWEARELQRWLNDWYDVYYADTPGVEKDVEKEAPLDTLTLPCAVEPGDALKVVPLSVNNNPVLVFRACAQYGHTEAALSKKDAHKLHAWLGRWLGC